jgi:hypothetical protein
MGVMRHQPQGLTRPAKSGLAQNLILAINGAGDPRTPVVGAPMNASPSISFEVNSFGRCLRLNGTDGALNTPVNLSKTSAVTVSTIVTILASTATQSFIYEVGEDVVRDRRGIAMYLTPLYVEVWVGIGGSGREGSTYYVPSPGTYVFTTVHDASKPYGSKTLFYINGVLQTPMGYGDRTTNTGLLSNGTLNIGARMSSNYWTKCDIALFLMFDRALTFPEVQSLFYSPWQVFEDPYDADLDASTGRVLSVEMADFITAFEGHSSNRVTAAAGAESTLVLDQLAATSTVTLLTSETFAALHSQEATAQLTTATTETAAATEAGQTDAAVTLTQTEQVVTGHEQAGASSRVAQAIELLVALDLQAAIKTTAVGQIETTSGSDLPATQSGVFVSGYETAQALELSASTKVTTALQSDPATSSDQIGITASMGTGQTDSTQASDWQASGGILSTDSVESMGAYEQQTQTAGQTLTILEAAQAGEAQASTSAALAQQQESSAPGHAQGNTVATSASQQDQAQAQDTSLPGTGYVVSTVATVASSDMVVPQYNVVTSANQQETVVAWDGLKEFLILVGRAYRIPGQVRVVLVGAEDRTYHIPAETRTTSVED